MEYNGILEDPRTPEEKELIFEHDELFSGIAEPKWDERAPKKYPLRWQDGSSGCVMFALAKILGIDEEYEGREYVELSPRDGYVERVNIGSGGMFFPNAMDIAKKQGLTLESLVPSENKGESLLNSREGITAETRKIGLKYKTAGYVELPLDMDKIASITSMGKGVLMGFRFDREEWAVRPWVKQYSQRKVGHAVACVDNVLKNGIKILAVDDSWDVSFVPPSYQREITAEFLKERGFWAGYTINFIYEEGATRKPKHKFKFSMRYDDKNADVKILQDILKYEGLFPLDTDSTGWFRGATKRGVIKLQEKYADEILKPVGLTKGTGFVGASTLKFLNKKYA